MPSVYNQRGLKNINPIIILEIGLGVRFTVTGSLVAGGQHGWLGLIAINNIFLKVCVWRV